MATRDPDPATPAQGAAADSAKRPGGTPPTPPPPTPGDLAALLLELLRKINAEVPTTPPLQGRAEEAVKNYRFIAQALRTLADGPIASIGTGNPRRP